MNRDRSPGRRTAHTLLTEDLSADLQPASPDKTSPSAGEALVDVGCDVRVHVDPASRFAAVLRARMTSRYRVRVGRGYEVRAYMPVVDGAGWVSVPRGGFARVCEVAASTGLTLTVRSATTREGAGRRDVVAERPGRPYEVETVKALLRSVQGWVSCPASGDPAWALAAAAVRLSAPTVVLVPDENRRRAWAATLASFGVAPRTSGLPPMASEVLVMLYDSVPDRTLQAASVLILDGDGHNADRWVPVVSRCAARWRWAVCESSDRDFMLEVFFGPCLMRVELPYLVANGWSVPSRRSPIDVDWDIPEHCRAWVSRCDACAQPSEYALAAYPRTCPRRGCTGTLTAKGLVRGGVYWPEAEAEWVKSPVLRAVLLDVMSKSKTARTLVVAPTRAHATALARHFTLEGLSGGVTRRRSADAGLGADDRRLLWTSASALPDVDLDAFDLLVLGTLRPTDLQEIHRPCDRRRLVVVDLVARSRTL